MALTSKEKAKQLSSMLDAVERGNKRDAADYTSGFLNEANLHKPPEFWTHKGWKGADKNSMSVNKHSKLPRPKKVQDDNMKNALTQFSVGSDGFLPSVKRSKVKKPFRHPDWPDELVESVDEKALIEEIDSRRLMLNRSQPTRLQKTWAIEDEENEKEVRKHDSKSVPPKHEFYSLNSGATKRDQFKDFKLFETNFLRKQDILERNTLAGEQGALRLEEKLNRNLMIIGTGPGTAFYRLQAHSDIMQELIESSPIFSHILKQVKTEYDEYVEWLLDTQPTQSHVLRQQVDDLYDKRVSNPKQLEQAKRDTNRLEDEGRKLLELNDHLRAEVKKEGERASKHSVPDLYSQRPIVNPDDKSHFDLADQLQDLHTTVLERLDKLEEMRAQLREEYVPSNVCQNLEQCLKDSEVEVQKLLKQNEIMGKNIVEMEDDISKAIDECDVSEKDKQKCWEKVSRTHIPGIKRAFDTFDDYSQFFNEHSSELPTNLTHAYQEGESSEDEDEEQTRKWNWYIS